jgi:tetratricopeptide (TPR) repeat protein
MAMIAATPVRGIVPALVLGALLLAPQLNAQKNFNQEEKIMVEKHKRARPHLLKAGAYLEKGKPDKARKEIAACLEILPEYAEALLLRAQLNYQEGALEPALKDVDAAKSNFTAFSKFFTYTYQDYLDRLRDDRDRQETLINELERAVSNATTIDQRRRLEAEVAKAKQVLLTIDNRLRDPIPPILGIPAEYHFIHGNILFKMKRFEEARGFYEAAVQADPRHANANNNLIALCLARGDMAAALKYLEQAEANGVAVNEKLIKAVLEKK